jgi:hypothetical protein
MLNQVLRLSLACVIGLLIGAPVKSQKVFDGSQQGLPPFGSFHGSSFDNVSLQNGNLHIEIPILSVPQRNGKVFNYRFIYDTRTYQIYWEPNPDYPQTQPKGWWFVEYGSYDEWRPTDPWRHGSGSTFRAKKCGQNTYSIQTHWQIGDPDGTQHQVGYKTVNPPNGCESGSPSTWSPTLDGTGMILDTSAGGSVVFRGCPTDS